MADLPFTSFQFPANPTIGANTLRSMPVRLAEVKNVLDFGADPNGTNTAPAMAATRAAIQAAVDWTTTSPNRGTIYFPMGTYRIDAPITFNYNGDLSICFRGEIGTIIIGNFNDFIFKRTLGTPNNTAGGRIFERLVISNEHATGGSIRMGSTIGGVVRDCQLGSYRGITTEDAVGVSSRNLSVQNCKFTGGVGTVGLTIGGGGVVENCNFIGCGTGVVAYGMGLHAAGNRQEGCDTAWQLGKDSAGNPVGLSGFSIVSSTFEGNLFGFDFVGPCDGFYLGSHHMMGHDSSNAGVLDVQGTQCSIRIGADCAKNGVICASDMSSWHDVACIQIANATVRTNLVFSCIRAVVTGGVGVSWILPTNAYTAVFEECDVNPIWTFAQLPSGAVALEGDEFDISDGTDGLTWGQTATNTGSHTTHYRVRWNGSVWTIMGK